MVCFRFHCRRLNPYSMIEMKCVFSFPRRGATLFRILAASLALAASSPGQQISLGGLDTVYTGTAKTVTVTTTPANLTNVVHYRDRSLPPVTPVSEVIFKNRPDTMDLSYSSIALAPQKMDLLGNVVVLGGDARELETCEATLVTWAKASSYPALAAANPAGYEHPITLSIFRVTAAFNIALLTKVTKTVLVPWRPTTLPNGQPYPYNGYAFRVNFDIPQGTLLPERVMIGVGYSTSQAGSPKMPAAGPYDTLNVGLFNPTASVGTDDNPAIVYNMKGTAWFSSSGWAASSGPMIRMTATTPLGETTAPPVNAGSYDVRAELTHADRVAHTRGILTIQKAPVAVSLSGLVQPRTGAPRTVGFSTVPTGFPADVTYNGSPTAPTAAGLYQVAASVSAPNHQGTANGVLRVGDLFSSWITGKTPAGQAGEADDPDGDGLANLLEYGFALLPGAADNGAAAPPRVEREEGNLAIHYQENLDAADLTYVLERSIGLAAADSWAAVTPSSRTVVSETGTTRLVKLTVPLAAEESGRGYFRVRIVSQ